MKRLLLILSLLIPVGCFAQYPNHCSVNGYTIIWSSADVQFKCSPSTSININGAAVSNPNFNGTTPAAPAGNTNVTWQVSGSSVSGYVPTAGSGSSLIGMLTPSPLTPPVLSDFAWGNQGNATASTNAGGGVWIAGSGAQQDVRLLYVTLPPAPWTIVCGYMPGNVPPLLVLRESATGKMVGASATIGFGSNSLGIFKYTSYTVFSATYINNPIGPQSLFDFWKIVNDGTNYTWYWSIDGDSWTQYLQKPLNDFFTTAADQAGIAINPSSTVTTGLLWVYWLLTTP